MKTLAMALAVTAALTLTLPMGSARGALAADDGGRVIEVTILGMVCPFCSYGVQQKLKRLEGIAELDVDLERDLATLRLDDESDLSNEILLQTVKDAGFEVMKITRNFESEFPDWTSRSGAELGAGVLS